MSSIPADWPFPPITFAVQRVFDAAFDSGWQRFPGHYLLYASSGAFHLEVSGLRYLLPPQRAAWVASGVPLRLSAAGPGITSSVLYAPDALLPPAEPCRVFAVSALARELLLYCMRWGPQRDQGDTTAEAGFKMLAHVCLELAAAPDAFWLPRASSPELERAIEYTLAYLATPSNVRAVAAACHLSERTLARRFASETGMTYRQFVHRARMIRAMEQLADPQQTVLEVAYDVGFSSVSAFTHAFGAFAGETPSAYRRRLQPA
jgi:AraC-like DNA-binding protein